MFTGIIEQQVKIIKIENGKFTIENPFSDLTIGQSISHDGACMTLTDISSGSYTFFAMEETLNRTNFGTKKIGDTFNIERCMRMDSRLDGHFVTGHIDTTGRVENIENKSDNSRIITIQFPSDGDASENLSKTSISRKENFFERSLLAYKGLRNKFSGHRNSTFFRDFPLVEKGSIAVNGASLTVVDVGDDFFTISLIPHTLEVTNIGQLKVGDVANLEFDLLGKYVAKQINSVRSK